MSIEAAMAISASGLDAQRLRLNVISSNLANVNSTRSPQGGPYRRQDVLFAAVPVQQNFAGMLQNQMDSSMKMVQVLGTVEDPRPLKTVYDPSHPDANPDGFVNLPNINAFEEMVNLISATRSYEANITALSATKSMAAKALEIGR